MFIRVDNVHSEISFKHGHSLENDQEYAKNKVYMTFCDP